MPFLQDVEVYSETELKRTFENIDKAQDLSFEQMLDAPTNNFGMERLSSLPDYED